MSEVQRSAAQLSKLGASRGGQARANRLSANDRSEIARAAAQARWGVSTRQATHSGELQVGGRIIQCAVLDDGVRVVNQSTLLSALGRNRRPKQDDTGTVLFAANLQPYISSTLAEALRHPISYRAPNGGQKSVGFPAEILPDVCEVYLEAQKHGKLWYSQKKAAEAADILIRGLARVGVIALVDEATGYQEVRARAELQAILQAYIQAELQPWVKRFPDEFFREIYRLNGWEFKPGTAKRTPLVGKLINEYVYKQLPPGVLEELRRINPVTENGRRAHKHHQHLTADTGNSHLDKQIMQVTMLMRIAKDKADFIDLFERAFPPIQMRFPLIIDEKI